MQRLSHGLKILLSERQFNCFRYINFFPPELKTIMAQNIGKEMYTLKIDL